MIGVDNGSGKTEAQMTDADWLLRGTQQGMSMLNGLSWQEANAGRNGAPTAGDFDGDWSDLDHANWSDRIDDEYVEAKFDQLVRGVFDGDAAIRP
jgi:hypothetical protein